MPAPAIRLPIGTIVTARDSWSRMVPLPRLRAPGQQQAQAALPEAAGGDAAGYRRRLRLRAPGNKKPFGSRAKSCKSCCPPSSRTGSTRSPRAYKSRFKKTRSFSPRDCNQNHSHEGQHEPQNHRARAESACSTTRSASFQRSVNTLPVSISSGVRSMPSTLQPYVCARYRAGPPIPHPTSRTRLSSVIETRLA